MLLFADGFENFDVTDLDKKWDSNTGYLNDADHFFIVKNNERKGDRCLYYNTDSSNWVTYLTLTKNIKKSRTVFFGVAVKHLEDGSPIKIGFYSNTITVAECTITVGTSGSTRYTWTFATGVASQTIVMGDTTPSINKFVYYEFGITLNGNNAELEDSTAWIENRSSVGQYHEKTSNIQTAIVGSDSSFFINSVTLTMTGGYYAGWRGYVDDVYVCNDEGSFNNTFLGDTRIRSMTPSFYGSMNETEMVNFDGFRHLGVAADFVNTVDTLPDPLPDPEQNPDFIPWQDPTTQCLRLNEEGAIQLFRMTNPNYGGAQPRILGVVGTAVCRAKTDIGKQAKLQLVRRKEYDPVMVSEKDAILAPIKTTDWQSFPLIMENEDEELPGVESKLWTPAIVSNADWGFKLLQNDTDPKEYLPGHLRLQLNHDEILYEYLLTQDFTHRFWDRLVDEILNITSWSASGWAHFAYETMGLEDMETVVRRGLKGINEQLYIKDEIPWQYIFIKEILQIDDPMFFAWGGDVFESLEFGSSSYHEFVEMVTSQVDLFSSQTKTDIGEVVREVIGLEEPLVWDNHESLEENINMIVSYVWTNHEVIEEWITHAVITKMGFGQDVVSSINLIEEHFDGWWVEELTDRALPWGDQITQHWRYEWFMGVLINSIKMTPIEDTGQWGGDGNDGDHTGLINWN